MQIPDEINALCSGCWNFPQSSIWPSLLFNALIEVGWFDPERVFGKLKTIRLNLILVLSVSVSKIVLVFIYNFLSYYLSGVKQRCNIYWRP